MKRFELDELQVDAILELKLYRLAKLEMLEIRRELGPEAKEASRVQRLLKSPAARWKLVRAELQELARRTPTRGARASPPSSTSPSSTPRRSSSTRTRWWSSPSRAG